MKSLWSDDLLLLTEAHSLDTQDEAIQLTLLLLSLFDLRTSLWFSLSHLVICIYEKQPSSLHLNELFKMKFLCETDPAYIKTPKSQLENLIMTFNTIDLFKLFTFNMYQSLLLFSGILNAASSINYNSSDFLPLKRLGFISRCRKQTKVKHNDCPEMTDGCCRPT